MILRRVHVRMRREKMQLFFSLVGDGGGDTLLDVGGAPGFGTEFQDMATRFRFRCSMNLDANQARDSGGWPVVGDGCQMPFATASFDWVFSNAVIEHVGSREQQRLFAAEIRRVARKGYFVATPNRNFPVDPHTLLPFFQYFSHDYQKLLCRIAPRKWIREKPQAVDLLSAEQLRSLFPGAKVFGLGLPIANNNLVAMFRSA